MNTNYYLFTEDSRAASSLTRQDIAVEHTEEPALGYRVHLCKKSCGTDPLFRFYSVMPSVALMLDFIASLPSDWQIQDEYGKTYTMQEFRDLVARWHQEIEDNPDRHHRQVMRWAEMVSKIDFDGFTLTTQEFA